MYLILVFMFYYKICERSISGSDAAPSSPAALEFVRGRLLASGFMIRPSEGGSTIYLVDHMDLEVLFLSSCSTNYTVAISVGHGWTLRQKLAAGFICSRGGPTTL